MKKIISIFMLGFVFIANANGGVVDTLTAKKVAANFYLEKTAQTGTLKSQQIFNRQTSLRLIHEEYDSAENLKNASEPLYYIFNVQDNRGYVIVSADDRITPVLGYSFKGSYDENQKLPPAFKAWMDNYKKQIIALKTSDLKAAITVNPLWEKYAEPSILKSAASIAEVTPMVSTTWNQGNYYNNFCPENSLGHALTGCVATAMAQIMKFWDYPASCTAIPGYEDQPEYDLDHNPVPNTDYGTIPSVSPTTYDWTSMPSYLNSSSSSTKVDAVAELLYHCGVSVQMDYGPYVSSSYVNDVVGALRSYFDYSSTTHMVFESSYSGTAWKNLLLDELNNGRPFIYRGDDNGATGHAWVCDGYQGTDFFHFNWGWGGFLDNYFYLDDITPLDMNFNSHQAAVIGIVPKNLVNLADVTLNNASVTSPATVDVEGTVDVEVAQNYSGTSSSVSDVVVRYYLSIDCSWGGSDILLGEDLSSINTSNPTEIETATLIIPAETPTGSYKILFVADATNVVQESNEGNNVACIDITVNGIAIPEDVTLSNVSVSATTIDAGGTVDVQADQYYSGTAETVPNVYLYYYLSSDCTRDFSDRLLAQDYSTINASDEYDTETAGLDIPENTAAGTYYLLFVADATNVVDEEDETNNTVCIEIIVNEVVIPEDVFVANAKITSSDTVTAGGVVDVSVDQNYSGDSATVPNVYLQYYLSTDCSLDGGDIYLDDDYSTINSIDATDTETASLTMPEGTEEGDYYILFVGDATNVVDETDNDNNVTCAPITIIKEEAKLVNLAISGPAYVNEDSTAFYTCIATYSDSSKVDVTELATWETNSANTEILLGTLSAGSVSDDESMTIIATYEGISDSLEIIITDVPPTLVYLTIEGPIEVKEDSAAFYTCLATYSDSSQVDITAFANWQVNSDDAEITSGVLIAGTVKEDKTVIISADFENLTSEFEIIITDVPPTLVYLTINGQDEIKEDSIANFTCIATYSDSTRVEITNLAAWEVSSVNAIIENGSLSALKVDNDEAITLSVSYEDRLSVFDVTIKDVPPTLVSLTIDGPSVVDEKSTAFYSCFAMYSDSSVTDATTMVSWELSTASALMSSGFLVADSVTFDEDLIITASLDEKSGVRNVIIKNFEEPVFPVLWEEGFERDALGTFPESWISAVNTTDSVHNILEGIFKTEGEQSLQLYGTVGSCEEAMAFRFVGREMVAVSMDVKCGTEVLSGCYSVRAGIGLQKENSDDRPARSFIEFRNDGNIYTGEGVILQPYDENVWINLLITYEMATGDMVKTTYIIDNKIAGEYFTPVLDTEDELNYLQLAAYEGSVWFDNIKVYRLLRTNVEDIRIDNAVKVYPNPARDFVIVSLASPGLIYSEVKIINATGSTVKTARLNADETKLDVSDMVSGIYIIQIQKDGMIYNKKLILDTGR